MCLGLSEPERKKERKKNNEKKQLAVQSIRYAVYALRTRQIKLKKKRKKGKKEI